MYYGNRLVSVKVTFEGLYFWGSGWANTDVIRKWHEFLRDYKGIMWSYFCEDKGYSKVDHLVSTSANVYLHPMGFNTYISLTGSSSRIKNGQSCETFPEVESLVKFSKDIARYCGGVAKIDYIKLHEFNDEGAVNTTDVMSNVMDELND